MPRVCSISRLSLIALLLAAFSSVAWAKPKVAVLGLEVANSGALDPKDAQNASKLTEELRKNPGAKYELASGGNRELQDEKVMGGCDTEAPACMAPIGKSMGAEYLVYGRIEKATEKGTSGYKAVIKILNVKEKKVEETYEGFVPTSQIAGSDLRSWSTKVYARLAGEKPPLVPEKVDRPPGKLLVKIGNAKSGQVSIDGSVKGALVDGTFTTTLSEGAHRIEIEAPDRKPYADTVVIASGQTSTVDTKMEEMIGVVVKPPPGGGGGGGGKGSAGWRKVMWAGVAGGAVGGGLWIYGWQEEKKALRELCKGGPADCDQATPGVDYGGLTDKGEKGQLMTYIGGGMVVVGGTLAVLGLWKGYLSKGGGAEKQQVGAHGRRVRRELTVTPVISPDGGGATVRFDW